MRAFILPLAAALFLVGCIPMVPAPRVITTSNEIEMPAINSWDTSFEAESPDRWYLVAKTRFADPVIFMVHGGYDENNVWTAYPAEPRKPLPVQQIAEVLHNLYPEQDIVLICCNAKGHDINVPRVWYAKERVWQTPDKFALGHESLVLHDSVGNIWEFVTQGGKLATTQATTLPTTRPIILTPPSVPLKPTTRPTTQPLPLPTYPLR